MSFHLESPDLGLQSPALAQPQTGVVGDISVSRKGKNYHESPFAEDLALRNFLYLEWFDQVNGRVLIESSVFTVELSERQWELSVEDESAQKMKNLDAMREFVCKYIQRDKRSDLWSQENADEFQWEKRFQESDRLTDAFQEVMEKYADDAEREIKQSYVMGWSSELDRQEDNLLMEEEISEIELLDEFDDLDGSAVGRRPDRPHGLAGDGIAVALAAGHLLTEPGDLGLHGRRPGRHGGLERGGARCADGVGPGRGPARRRDRGL